MKTIKKIKLLNFKRFPSLEIEFQDDLNLLIGDNEAGKSSILSAIDLVLSGSHSKVESLGIDVLLNSQAVESFFAGAKQYNRLPKLEIELYLNDQQNAELNGRANSENRTCDGLRLCCEPNDSLSHEISQILSEPDNNFPFEYYTISFKTFANHPYTGYTRYLNHVLIDSSQINNEYATKEYVKNMYRASVSDVQRYKHSNEYRRYKGDFTNNKLIDVNRTLSVYQFGVRNSTKANLFTDLTLNEGSINIENKGKGKQCFIKTDFALNRRHSLDLILLEEPENHLSHAHTKKLIDQIKGTAEKQLFISTHNSLISTRLDLRKSILLNSNTYVNAALKDLSRDTAKFFMKAPDNSVIEFVLSNKVLLVEGDAEYILLEQFYRRVSGSSLDADLVHVISVDGTSFKRYMELAALLNIRTAVIRDNDGDYKSNCIDNYAGYTSETIQVFADQDPARRTLEICVYQDNTALCDRVFTTSRRELPIQEYMLKNKTEAAFKLLDDEVARTIIVTPNHIAEAIRWIRE
ncbi:ATP-dependent nuclease [Chitinophaga pinensis]|uniref:ATP-dependent endonuclease n=1 Tax=Chitinophaga pinensis (strain ATCC 43595 / DSM 2588 / LMG 13176 / NBRC 15968 / NCIMB 11800 / UQM 2034) TaxID=485918 RepID=A0A979G455_CHIPD|nr:TOPRIM nucleotidyl transferase/hydrolase domain-containing protein [Chitinophaga pinensis]ACU60489.1 conserved hypothetical protein [Chitinophaga pinensis DSM 2588]